MARDQSDLFALLDDLGISHQTRLHEPLFTVAQSQMLRGTIDGLHTRNLFLKDKKSSYFLVVVEENASVDLKTIHTAIGGSGRVSFGSPEAMMEMLGVVPGSVTVFGLINDTEHRLSVVIDQAVVDAAIVNGHPLVNTATTSIAGTDLLRFIRATGHEPKILKVTA